MNRTDKARRIVQEHYGLYRYATIDEVADELAMLKRRGRGNWDDSQERLAARLAGLGFRFPDFTA
jgi:hypothetical protein